jgi:hypothetical protein
VGRRELSIRDPGGALVLDRGDPGHAVSGSGDDALLLHFQDALGSGLSATALRRTGARTGRHLVCRHDCPDERREHVLDGARLEGGAGVGYPLQHLGGVSERRRLRRVGRAAFGDLQRGAAIRAHLGGCAAGSGIGLSRSGWLERHADAHPSPVPLRRLHAPVAHVGIIQRQPHGDPLDWNCLWAGVDRIIRLLDHRLSGGAARTGGAGSARGPHGADHWGGFQNARTCDRGAARA